MNPDEFQKEHNTKLDHIGIAVSDLEAAIAVYKQLGLTPIEREIIADQGVEVVVLPAGETRLELVYPLDEDTPVGKFITKHGEGLHHLALEVKDINAALQICRRKGIIVIDQEPCLGAGGRLIAFLDPRSTGGVLIELIQKIP